MATETGKKTFDGVPSANIIRSPRQRSPNYPSISLPEAVERASKLYKADGRSGSPLESAVKHFGFNRPHGTAMALISALRKYGLVESAGGRIALTQRTIDILVFPDGDDRKVVAVRDAALAPDIYAGLYNRYLSAGKLPSEITLKAELEAEMKFNPKAVADLVRDFKASLLYAGLLEEDGVTLNPGGGESVIEAAGMYVPKVGDYVQWEPKGILQFPEPKRVRALSDDGQFAFVDGSPNGAPVAELTLQARPKMPPVIVNAPSDKSTMRQDVFSLSAGQVVLQWPAQISADSIQDVKDWLKIVERKIERSVSSDKKEPSE